MSERHNRAIAAYKLKSVAERNSKAFIKLTNDDFRERGRLYYAAMGDDANYQLLLADMLFEQTAKYAKLGD
jgi:hypothetical protein